MSELAKNKPNIYKSGSFLNEKLTAVDIQACLKQALQNAPIIVAHIDTDLRYRWVYNPHSDFKAEECIGKRDDELAQNSGIEELMALKIEVLATGRKIRKEISFLMEDDVRIYDVSGEPLFDEEKNIIGLATASTDITTYKIMEEEIARLNSYKQIGQLAEGLADTLRNPMTTVQGFLQVLRSNEPIENQMKEILIKELEQINHIICFLIFLSSKKRVNRSENNINNVIIQSINKNKIEHRKKKYHLNLLLEYNLPLIYIDSEEISELISHLLNNSVESIKDNGKIDIKTKDTEEYVQVIVSDNGVGMCTEQLSKCLDPFYTFKENHLGLGLPISFCIAERNGGELKINSVEGKGTICTVKFFKKSSVKPIVDIH
ncbi:ATP-binding protein [Alkalihalobacterium elongatum]|uniref:ATP-binding protein n=1 Tax=Alkalihalobacterium elongatum TaxID=2675466 RepID=UPI001C1FFD45|nr:ATP-binding protein [Alkalihalobacterium elongatum]